MGAGAARIMLWYLSWCGWGCWMNNSGVAARRTGRTVDLIGIEGDEGHLKFARDALARNGYATRLFSPGDVARYRRSALRDATELLVQNRIVVIFPEGYPNIDPTYTPKNHLNEFLFFKPGFLRIISAAEKRAHRAIPIIPAGLYYHPPEYRAAVVRFGEPVWRDRFSDPLQLLRFLERRVKELSIE